MPSGEVLVVILALVVRQLACKLQKLHAHHVHFAEVTCTTFKFSCHFGTCSISSVIMSCLLGQVTCKLLMSYELPFWDKLLVSTGKRWGSCVGRRYGRTLDFCACFYARVRVGTCMCSAVSVVMRCEKRVRTKKWVASVCHFARDTTQSFTRLLVLQL